MVFIACRKKLRLRGVGKLLRITLAISRRVRLHSQQSDPTSEHLTPWHTGFGPGSTPCAGTVLALLFSGAGRASPRNMQS